jgi:hypothetical protein
MTIVRLPPGWEHRASRIATLLTDLGSPLIWWAVAVALLAGAFILLRKRPGTSVCLAVAATLALGVSSNGLVDDAYIQFRYAANLAAGHGPVFNPGERIEGASGGLWIGLLALASASTGLDPGIAGRLLSLLAGGLATAGAAAVGLRIGGRVAAATAALAWAALPTQAIYAATGLETSLFSAALWFLGAAILHDRADAAAAAGALVAVLRPEGLFLGAGALPFWRRLNRSGRLALLSLLAAAAAIAFARFLYYGSPLPRPVLVKGVIAGGGFLEGLRYLGGRAFEWWPLLLALPLAARRVPSALPFVVPAAAWSLMVVTRGGDWMPGSRYLLPLLVLLVSAVAAGPARAARLLTAVPVIWGLLLLAPLEQPSRLPVGSVWRDMAEHRVQSRWWESIGAWLRSRVPPDTRLATGPSGALPYASRLQTFDMYGLCSRVSNSGLGEVGHRLWGVPEAVASGVDILYAGQKVPQSDDWGLVLGTARLHVRSVSDFEKSYRPLGIAHTPEYHLDLVSDLLWVRPSLYPLLAEER